MPTLHAIPYSPWSERARWALLHHGIAFHEKVHQPVFGELALRRAAKRWRGRVSVPLFVDGEDAVMDSFAIAEHVDRIGKASRLFPVDLHKGIRELGAQIEPIFEAGRARVLHVLQTDDEAALAAMPPAARKLPFAAASGRLGSKIIGLKYGVSMDGVDERLRDGFLTVRRLLGGRPYLHDTFTYADILAATTVQVVSPVDNRFIPLSAIRRRTWTHEVIAREFTDLVAWRDAIYEKHRPVSMRGAL